MQLKAMVQTLGALAQETRLAVYRHLVPAGPQGLPAGAIADALGVSAPTLSFHLKELEQTGLISQRREGRQIFYACDFSTMRAVVDFLQKDCCSQDTNLCAPSKDQSRRRKIMEPSS